MSHICLIVNMVRYRTVRYQYPGKMLYRILQNYSTLFLLQLLYKGTSLLTNLVCTVGRYDTGLSFGTVFFFYVSWNCYTVHTVLLPPRFLIAICFPFLAWLLQYNTKCDSGNRFQIAKTGLDGGMP
jgi:hypothetical protein